MNFSVIIPCYNSSKTIERTLQSIANQTYLPHQVILVDDASDDFKSLSKVVSQFKKRLPISILKNSTNKNGAYSRNVGIDYATGDYVAFIDSDDTWVEDRLESALNIIQEQRTNNFIIYGQFELVRSVKSKILLPIRSINPTETVAEYVFAAGQQMQTSTFICSLDVARKIKFDALLTRHQDSDFMMRAQSKGISFIFQNKKCASYYFNRGELIKRMNTGRISEKFCHDWLINKEIYLNSRAVAGYKIIVFSRILYLQDQKIKALMMILLSLPRLGIRNLFDLILVKSRIFFG